MSFLNSLLSCILLLVALLSCADTADSSEKEDALIGDLTETKNISLFAEPTLLTPITTSSSHALVLQKTPQYLLLLSDGNLVWTPTIETVIPTRLTSIAMPIGYTTLPFTQFEAEGPVWRELGANQTIILKGVTTERYAETPHYIRDVGRMLYMEEPSKPFFWPQIHFTSNGKEGWASIIDLTIKPETTISSGLVSGLLQKPFFGLVEPAQADGAFLSGESYIEYTFQDIETHDLPRLTWQLEQVVLLANDSASDLRSVRLFSAEGEKCYIFSVLWKSQQSINFGLCDRDYGSSPTPVMLGYTISQQAEGGMLLEVVEVMGDEDRIGYFGVSGTFNEKSSIYRSRFRHLNP